MKVNYQDLGALSDNSARAIGQSVIIPTKDALRQLRTLVTGNITLEDNAYAAVVTLGYAGNSTRTLTSGTEYVFQNPLPTLPIGFVPITAVNADGVAITIAGCKLNTSRPDGLLGVTCLIHSSTGYIGELVSASLGAGSATALANGTAKTIVSAQVTHGDWRLWGAPGFTCTAALTGTRSIGSVSLTTNTLGVLDSRSQIPAVAVNGVADVQIPTPHISFSTASSATVYLVSQVNFSAGNTQGYGAVLAQRTTFDNGQTGLVTGILWGG